MIIVVYRSDNIVIEVLRHADPLANGRSIAETGQQEVDGQKDQIVSIDYHQVAVTKTRCQNISKLLSSQVQKVKEHRKQNSKTLKGHHAVINSTRSHIAQ